MAGDRARRSRTPTCRAGSCTTRGAEDIEAVFASAAHVFEHDVHHAADQHHGYMEPHATLVWIDEAGIVHVVTHQQVAALACGHQMAATLGIPPGADRGRCRRHRRRLRRQGLLVDEYACYFLAKATGRPVKAVTRYADELAAYNVRHAARMRLRSAVDAEGHLLAHQARMVFDGGAYAAAKPMPAPHARPGAWRR